MLVRIELGGNAEELLRQFQARASDLSGAMKDIAYLGESVTRERFASETAPDGTPWKPSRRKLESGGSTLTKDGHLADSVSSSFGPTFAQWGVNRPYAAIHQFGGTITAKNGGFLKFPGSDGDVFTRSVTIPARPFLPATADEMDMETIQEILALHLRGN